MAAAAGLAEKSGRVESLFLNSEVNANGIYGVDFYTLGVPHTVIVDDILPLYKAWDGTLTTNFAKVGADGSFWGPILEKAFAKYHGNWLHIEGGVPAMATKTIYGAPAKYIDHTMEWGENIPAATIWKEVSAAVGRGDVI